MYIYSSVKNKLLRRNCQNSSQNFGFFLVLSYKINEISCNLLIFNKINFIFFY